MTMLSESSQYHGPRLLLAVREWREEVRAGLGNAQVAIRTLDGVSLAVHVGDLVIVRGGLASGAPALLTALAGTRARVPAARLAGERIAARGVQIRRAAISLDAFRALSAVWRAPGPSLVRESRVVYFFRVRLDRQRPEDEGPWRAWARAFRSEGGTVVAHVTQADPMIYPRDVASHASSVFEHGVDSTARERQVLHAGRVHDLTLADGRIVRATRGASGAFRTDPLHSSRRRARDRSDHDARDGHY